jgi:myosin-3
MAHEQLQFFFNRHTFQLELEEYAKEGIDVQAITFKDNMALIDMFMGKPVGILSLLDEECSFPKATDQTFIDKIEAKFAGHESYRKPEKSRGYPAFGIQHFAGLVEYNATNFLEKNRDNLAGGITELMQESKVDLVADVFGGEVLATGQIRARASAAERVRRGEVVKAETGNKVHRKTPSLSSQFKTSLSQLIERMTACYPHFVRCIKPNLHQQKDNFVPDFVRTQLRYTGVLEATRIRQEGFSWRPTFSEFVQRYKILAFDTSKLSLVKETASSAERIVNAVKLTP